MKPRLLYAVLAIAGAVLPLWQFFPFVREHGLNIPLMFQQLFSTPVSAFFGVDVIVASVVLWVFFWFEGRRASVAHVWLPVLASLAVGVSLALPLFLYMRESSLDRRVE